MVAVIDSVKGQSLSKVIDTYSLLLLKALVTFGENKNFLRVGFNYFTEIGLKYLLTLKDLIKPAGVLVKKKKSILNKKFVTVIEAISEIEAKDKHQDRIQAIIDNSKKYIGREINTTNVQDAALKQMVAGFKKYQVRTVQQPELKEAQRILELLLSMTQAFMRRSDLVDYTRSFKHPDFQKAVKDDPSYIQAEKDFFSIIKKFGMAYRTFFIFRNYYSMMIKRFQSELNRTGKIVPAKPEYSKSDVQLLDYLTSIVDEVVKVLEKVEWYLAPEIL